MDSGDEDISRDFNKISKQAFDAGYREGISDGKEVIMQKGFDCGYSHGFELGLVNGFYKGFLDSVKNNLDESSSKQARELVSFSNTDPLLNEISKTSCAICKDSNLLNEPHETLNTKQIEKKKEIVNSLTQKYSPLLDEFSVKANKIMKLINVDSSHKADEISNDSNT